MNINVDHLLAVVGSALTTPKSKSVVITRNRVRAGYLMTAIAEALLPYGAKAYVVSQVVTLPNKSEIRFLPQDGAVDAVRGLQINSITIDENTDLSADDYTYLASAVTNG